jgi:hypothetical protein
LSGRIHDRDDLRTSKTKHIGVNYRAAIGSSPTVQLAFARSSSSGEFR